MSPDVVVDGLPYPIIIAADASRTLPRLVAFDCRHAVVIYDRNVEERARRITAALTVSGVGVRGSVPLTAGETAKRQGVVAALYDDLLGLGADRATWLVAVGGGTTTDVVGFVAATLLRGVPWAAVPTTVLAMADAAIGGKTGIDLAQGKNLVGAFWDPRAVVADLASLATLPPRELSTGLAEAIKCGVIDGAQMLSQIEAMSRDADAQAWKDAIVSSARVKAGIVADDPRESGRRAVLNLGHTVGHAIEHATSYRMPHGDAVAVGMRAAGLISRAVGGWPASDHARVLRAIRNAGLPLHASGLHVDAVMDGMTRDKKRLDGRLRFVLPLAIGDVRPGIEVAGVVVRGAVELCLAAPSAAELAG